MQEQIQTNRKTYFLAREEAQQEDLYNEIYASDSDNEWEGEETEGWGDGATGEDNDVRDEESAAYMEFLNQEVRILFYWSSLKALRNTP